MSDPVGTVRRSPDGVVVLQTPTLTVCGSWYGSRPKVRNNFWHADEEVAGWPVVHTPPTSASKLENIDTVLGSYQRGDWSAETALAAIARIQTGTLTL